MFPTKLRELREAAGYKSQQAFADAFGIAQSTVGNWEAGKREPNYTTTKKLADFFHVPIDYLIGSMKAQPYSEQTSKKSALKLQTLIKKHPKNFRVFWCHMRFGTRFSQEPISSTLLPSHNFPRLSERLWRISSCLILQTVRLN